jgi:Flp pilus assembly protein TadG
MEDLHTGTSVAKFVAPLIAAVVVAVGGVGYAFHEHNAAQQAAAQSQQAAAELASTRSQLNSLTAKVSELVTQQQTQAAAAQQAASASAPAAASPDTVRVASRAAGKPRASHVADRRLTKMQAQLDAQGKAIDDTRSDLASAKTELTGSIAKTHDELVVLEKRGERNYFEFDLQKAKAFAHEGPVGVSLRKANVKHQYADLELMVEDRDLSQKHVNLNQPVMFYQSDTEQPIQVVINSITDNHIHGYVSAPKYRKSELASMSDTATTGANAQQPDPDGIVGDTQTTPRKKLTVQPQN